MDHLLYSSNEMYSSTELIRKSKTIFNKILSNEIDKAIILRDGKPSFMLLDFKKYEKIMAEYEKIKGKKKLKAKHKIIEEENDTIEDTIVESVDELDEDIPKNNTESIGFKTEVARKLIEKKKQEIKEFWS